MWSNARPGRRPLPLREEEEEEEHEGRHWNNERLRGWGQLGGGLGVGGVLRREMKWYTKEHYWCLCRLYDLWSQANERSSNAPAAASPPLIVLARWLQGTLMSWPSAKSCNQGADCVVQRTGSNGLSTTPNKHRGHRSIKGLWCIT